MRDAHCSVAIETSIVGAGGYRCGIGVIVRLPNGKYDTSPIFKAERDAALETLCNCMTRSDTRKSDAFAV
ncbi:hypothetical protein KDX01_21100 [Burkholderia vietnamiensis]|uniref:hypothetical protein n=1 Tax=Burkholderia vietnamiensis TaxID=60552 RepID=UPI001BA35ABD|nr:hypothetical protein [Burkholderia vietnamiensis]MBR7975592.1 hypothetical protein [Burkholderia vietnamiensis]